MQTLHISRQELHTRGGVLDRMLDSLFDTAILVDTDCRILYISASSFPDPSQRAAVVGQHISVLDQLSPFEEVLRTGQPRPDLFLELHGRPCISSLFPVLDGERVIGVVGTITVRNLGRLKKVLSQLSDQAAGFRGLYQDLARVDSGYRLEDFVGESPRVADLLDKARKAAHSGESVLILGETGTGKELFAHSIHRESRRNAEPFVALNCAALPENLLESELFGYEPGAFSGASKNGKAGLFELAHKGTIFLDEIGEIPTALQAKLLRVLQEKEIRRIGSSRLQPVDVRVISATNINIEEKIREGSFRADLYYRLNLLDITIPPLRERSGDIQEMVDFYLTRFACEMGKPIPKLSQESAQCLINYQWPGNVRELRNICERLVVLSDSQEIGLKEIQMLKIFRPGENTAPAGQKTARSQPPEPEDLYSSLKPRKKKQDIARELGVSRTTLWRMERMAKEKNEKNQPL